MPVGDVDTPALLIDLDALERNLKRMADVADRAGVRLRPHAKSHKCPMIALKQLELGAVGVCCQKVSEAEAMVEGGVRDVLVTYEVIGDAKVQRLAALARHARVGVLADHSDQISAYSEAAVRYGSTVSVLVDVSPGGPRPGVDSGELAVELALRIAEAPNLRFGGLQAYNGPAQHTRTHAERVATYAAYADRVAEISDLLKGKGLTCETITGSGTGTHELEAGSGIFTEIQPGSYIFMDADYALNLDESGGLWRSFDHSLFILCSVMNCGRGDYAVVDAGTKAANIDTCMPTVFGRRGLRFVGAADEHGRLEISADAQRLRLGEKLRLVVGHCDPTVNLYDWIVCARGDLVEAVWPVAARGMVL